jgi:hypothetical protein
MLQNYSQLAERISKSSGLDIAEIERRVEAKRAKLSGLVSKEGAAQIVAAELGVNFEKQKFKIDELATGMRKVNIISKIIKMSPVRSYNKNGKEGKIASFISADEKANIRTVLWDSNHIALIEEGKIKEGDIVEISNATVRNTELHLSGFSDIKISEENIEAVVTEQSYMEKPILDLSKGDSAMVRAFIVQIFDPRFFEVCPECGKRVSETGDCVEHGKIVPRKRALLNLVLDDGSETIRAVLFNEEMKLLFDDDFENIDSFIGKRDEVLGEEFFFSGNIRQNKMFNNLEIFIESINKVEPEKLVEQLESK